MLEAFGNMITIALRKRQIPRCVCLLLVAMPLSLIALDSDIVINEIMFHPPNDREDLQYVELFNRGASTVEVSNWAFTKGIKFVFPQNTKINSGAYLVVCRNSAAFAVQYGGQISALGNFSGKLSHQGDHLELTDARKQIIDSVKYSDRGDWPTGPDGYSPSLERICPQAESQRAENWATSKLPPMKNPAGTPGKRNDSFSTNLPPAITKVEFKPPVPNQKSTISASIADADGVRTATLLYRSAITGRESAEKEIPMTRVSGDEKTGRYQADVEAQPTGRLLRFRIKAVDANGAVRFQPSENEPRPTYSFFTSANTNTALVPFGFVLHIGPTEQGARSRMGYGAARSGPFPTRGNCAFIYLPPGGGEVQTFDHVRVTSRKGGFKVRFQNDRTLNGMTTINVIFESSPRWILAEPLAYELYRLAGVPAELTDHIRVWMDDRPMGYHLQIEQPNKSFLTRNKRDDSGNLYKLIWYGQGVVGQHEKKTNPATNHEDLMKLINGLNRKSGAEQWEFIKQNFNVEEMASYFAVNMCLQNWDGFFNNYFAYHDTGGTGKWEMYPWDEDKTWGDYDGASRQYDWYEMPLTYGMNGDRSPGFNPLSRALNQGNPFGNGVSWWRQPGYFSGPLLANPEFRKLFLARLREICTAIFTEEKMFPIFDAMEKRLEPEVRVRAEIFGEDPRNALRVFHNDMQSFRNQVQNRRKFILSELSKER